MAMVRFLTPREEIDKRTLGQDSRSVRVIACNRPCYFLFAKKLDSMMANN
jgi:hypothetical protein